MVRQAGIGRLNDVEFRDGMRAGTAAAELSMDSPCFELSETRARTLRIEEEGLSALETSHAGIIRIGFEGISQPHLVEHPCFNDLIETFSGRVGKWGGCGRGTV